MEFVCTKLYAEGRKIRTLTVRRVRGRVMNGPLAIPPPAKAVKGILMGREPIKSVVMTLRMPVLFAPSSNEYSSSRYSSSW